MIVKSSSEDQLGLVQWDLGLWLNSLCSTLQSLESYHQIVASGHRHAPAAFVRQKHIISEQHTLFKALKLAICEIVHVFGPHLDMAGLEDVTADICQKVLDIECGRAD